MNYKPNCYSCMCPICCKHIYFGHFGDEKYLAKCISCNISIYSLFNGCDIHLEKYIINFNKNSVHIRNEFNYTIFKFSMEEDFNWDNIDKYYKTSLKIINNLIFL